ncbi:MAG: hypothetical protein ACXWLR_05410 [Myxococcales bacterium]
MARLRKEPLDEQRWRELARSFVVAYYATGDAFPKRGRSFSTNYSYKAPRSLLRDREPPPQEVKARSLQMSGLGTAPKKGWRFKLNGEEGWLVGDSYLSLTADPPEEAMGRGLAFVGERRTLVIDPFAPGEQVALRDAVDIDGDGSPEFIFQAEPNLTFRVVSLEKGAPVVRWCGGARPPPADEDPGD